MNSTVRQVLSGRAADHLETGLFDPARLTLLMEQLLDRREEWPDQWRGRVAEMRTRATKPRRSSSAL
ncbi:hypothetical protein [Aurantimonas sp. HBX-1]|uniref:hypothetical protein n=1 Tax=Aurantimonas sp. HBX-1 TaxID=2906072 RepID=UPI001F45E710|nr:hypothetical protein [Aurantimonas sp. HBX-1]UIJ73343.1 hypothetical protein LXB15_06800 [Aurantimonas sp. HBX-1]